MKRTIAIIGAGIVGSTLGRALADGGHKVRFGLREPRSPKYVVLERGGTSLHTMFDACAGAGMIILATPWSSTEAAIAGCGDLEGKIVLDATNPLSFSEGRLSLDRGFSTSGGEQVALWARGASVFKVLNQTGADNMGRANLFHPKAAMFVAGDDTNRKPLVMELVNALGFEAIDAGELAAARLLEPMAMLWINLSSAGRGRDFAFAIVKADTARR